MMRVQEIKTAEELTSYESQWRGLVARSASTSVFDTFEWQSAWLESFWQGKEIKFLFFWEGDSLVGVAPLLANGSDGLPWCMAGSITSTAHQFGFRSNVICAKQPERILQDLLHHLGQSGFPRLVFPDAMAGSPIARILPSAAGAAGLSCTVATGGVSPITYLRGNWESQLRTRSPHLAKEIHRKIRRFDAAGRSEVVVVSAVDECEAAMSDILQVESRSWKANVSASLSGNPQLARLYATFAMRAARSGLLKSYVLYLDRRPVSYVFGVVVGNEYYAFKTSYDAAFRQLSPGIVVLNRVLRDAVDDGLTTVDWGPGTGMRWKDEFSNDARQHVHICVFGRLRVLCQFCSAYRQAIKPFVRTVRSQWVLAPARGCSTVPRIK
jgi:CelD/BcsL family acetyltransferase involved in cellulose biosynthesis